MWWWPTEITQNLWMFTPGYLHHFSQWGFFLVGISSREKRVINVKKHVFYSELTHDDGTWQTKEMECKHVTKIRAHQICAAPQPLEPIEQHVGSNWEPVCPKNLQMKFQYSMGHWTWDLTDLHRSLYWLRNKNKTNKLVWIQWRQAQGMIANTFWLKIAWKMKHGVEKTRKFNTEQKWTERYVPKDSLLTNGEECISRKFGNFQ